MAFVLGSLTAGVGGIVHASRLRSISTSLDGGTLVLYAIDAIARRNRPGRDCTQAPSPQLR